VSRLPAHFLLGYLDDDANRFSVLPADLARRLDDEPDGGSALSGWVVQLENPRDLAATVGPAIASVVPAILDEIVRRLPNVRESIVFSPFCLFVMGAERDELAPAMGRFRRLLHLALADYLDALSVEQSGQIQPGAESMAEEVVSAASPRLRLYPLTLAVADGGTARGKRLMSYLLEERNLLEPDPRPSSLTL
jgi:hypothetical protein